MSGFLNNSSQFFGNGSGFAVGTGGGVPAAPTALNKSIGDASGGTVLDITVASSTGLTAAKLTDGTTDYALTSFSIVDGTTVRGTTPGPGVMPASATPLGCKVTNASGDSPVLASVFEAFWPTNISGGTATCIKWKDARFGITSSGGQITTHADQSGHGFDMNNFAAGLFHGPSDTLVTANGKPAVRYDPTRWGGSGDRLDAHPPAALTGASIVEAFVIGRGSSGTEVAIWNYGSGAGGFLGFGTPGASTNYENFGSTARPGSAGTFDVTGSVAYRVLTSTANLQTWINGVASINVGSNTLGWAALVTDGENTVAQNAIWDENAHIFFAGGLSSGDRARVEAWVLDCWGVTI